MSVSELYVLSAVRINPASLTINGIVDSGYDDGVNMAMIASDGDVDHTFQAIFRQSPRVRFTSLNVGAVLGQIGISGLNVAEAASGVDWYYAQVDPAGTRMSGSNHMVMSMLSGYMIPTSITARQDGEARIAVDTMPRWDGTNNPLGFATSVALPAITRLADVWTVGPAKINGTWLTGIEDISVDFGLGLYSRHADGDLWPTFVAVQRRRPTITLRTSKASAISSFGLLGVAQGATDSLIWLRKKVSTGTTVADNVASHIKFSIDDGNIRTRSLSAGSSDDPAMVDVIIEPKYDGTNAVLAISTGATIA